MIYVWLYTLISVIFVSLVSLVGVFTLAVNQKRLYKFLIYLVSFSAGALMGDAFIHLIPESFEVKNRIIPSILILLGILLFFVLEKIMHWRHCHEKPCENHPHHFSYMILIGDTIHNFIDGLVIGASYLAGNSIGIATTLAVVLHEIPQEIGDFGSLIYGGFSRWKALLYNFVSALAAVLGAVLVLLIGFKMESLANFLIPFAAGGFIYIAGSDLIPELHKRKELNSAILQILTFMLGIGIMFLLLLVE